MTEPPRPLSGLTNEGFLLREIDRIDRRINSLGERLEVLDQQGSRGLNGLRLKLDEVTRDLTDVADGFRTYQSKRWQAWLAFVAALAPMYVFAIQQWTGH